MIDAARAKTTNELMRLREILTGKATVNIFPRRNDRAMKNDVIASVSLDKIVLAEELAFTRVALLVQETPTHGASNALRVPETIEHVG